MSLSETRRDMAAQKMASERPGHTLQPTALVNEAYLRERRKTEEAWLKAHGLLTRPPPREPFGLESDRSSNLRSRANIGSALWLPHVYRREGAEVLGRGVH